VLLELRVGAAGDPALGIEDEAGRAGRSLVDRQDNSAAPRTIVSRPSAMPKALSLPLPSRRNDIPYIRAITARAWRSASGTSSVSSAAAATPS
jgi:hypothetical protein